MDKYYCVPHSLNQLKLTKNEQAILIALIKIFDQRDYEKGLSVVEVKASDCFFSTNKEIARLARVSVATVKRVKLRLKMRGLLRYRKEGGRSNKTKFFLPLC